MWVRFLAVLTAAFRAFWSQHGDTLSGAIAGYTAATAKQRVDTAEKALHDAERGNAIRDEVAALSGDAVTDRLSNRYNARNERRGKLRGVSSPGRRNGNH